MCTKMCKKMICLVSFVFLLGLVLTGVANAADPSLVGWWRFDETSGTIAYDSSGNGNDGSLVGGPQWVDGMIGGALDFDGTDHVEVPDSPSLDITDAITIAAWVNPQGTGDHRWLIAKRGWGTGATYGLSFTNGGSIEFGISTGTAWEFRQTIETISDGNWSHVVGQYSPPYLRVFINGQFSEEWDIGSHSINTNDIDMLISGQNDGQYYGGLADDVRIYSRVLTEAEIQQVMLGIPPELASKPSPADKATHVPREVVISWEPGEFAAPVNGHIVYLGDSFDDVNDAVGGGVQTAASYTPPQRLDFGKTYYWRVDEVNAPPTSHIEFKGTVWSFTTEPIAYPIGNITATASSQSENQGQENTVNGSGLDDNNLHSNELTTMWLSDISETGPAWIQYEFDKIYKLHEMWVWNHNGMMEPTIGVGFKDVSIEYSVNGTDYMTLGATHEFARASGASDYAHNTTVDFGGVAAKNVRITAISNWGSIVDQYGLSEVRFLYTPLRATEPQPESGATDVDVDLVLNWRAGREAAEHNVYIGTDEQAVIDNNLPVNTVTEASYGPISLDLGQTYYWKVNEVNEAETNTTWQGDIWNFTTNEFLIVDDFEDYNDYPPREIWTSWKDGYEIAENGSTVGYPNPNWSAGEHYVETTIVHGGDQSMPLFYDNSAAAYSEATVNIADLPIGSDWSGNGVKTLSLWFHGDPNNTAEQMYVKLNGVKVLYDGDASNLSKAGWRPWNINLADFSLDLSIVTELSIGIERGAGGSGMVLFDDICMYPFDRQLVTPAEPGVAGLVAHFAFDEGSGTVAGDSSGNGNDGTFTGNPPWVAGKIGGALEFDGRHDYIEVPDSPSLDITDAITIAAWVNPQSTGDYRWLVAKEAWGAEQTYGLCFTPSESIEFGISSGTAWLYRQTAETIRNGIWSHVAGQYSPPYIKVFINGQLSQEWDIGSHSINTNDNNLLIAIMTKADQFFSGLADDIRIYDRALTQEEIAWLAGVTKPFDKPF